MPGVLLPTLLALAAVPPTPDTPDAKKKAALMSASEKAAEAGLSKRDWKAQKRERQREDMLKRMDKYAETGVSRRPAPPSVPYASAPNQLAEDFDAKVTWEEKSNQGASGSSYGYSSANHFASVPCAAGELGGSVADNAISWFADKVSDGPALLSLDKPLSASGWCLFTSLQGEANLGWFNADTYFTPHLAPDSFIGWRQEGDAIHTAVGSTGSSFVLGSSVKVAKDKPFHWALSYTPTSGDHACGLVRLTVNGSSSTLSLTQEQKDALMARKLNRFGLVTAQTGASQASTLWLDNLTYTRVSGLPAPHPAATTHTRTAFFDTDPTGSTFLAVNTHSVHDPVTVTQDYGFRPIGGRTGGCIGGQFTQAIGTSYYGYDYGDKMRHFSDRLRSEGWFQVPSYEGRCFHIGWTSKAGKSWHEPSTLGLRISSIGIKGKGLCLNIAPEGTLRNHEGHGGAGWGTLLTLPAGPDWHHYIMEFDPAGARGLGTFTVQIDDTSKVYYFGEDKLKEGADIDLFGMWNAKIPAEKGAITAYLDDVINTTNGERDPASNDFNTTPVGWVGANNAFTAKDYIVRPFHEFGWAGALPYLDGKQGYSPMYVIPEADRHTMGGIIYLASYSNLNVPRASYGAELNSSLNTKAHHLYATGRFKLDWANVDAGELVGWFDSKTACDDITGGKGHGLPNNFLGVAITGGSSGYGMIPCYRSRLQAEERTLNAWNPATRVYQDGEWREFYLEYNPDGADGKGQLTLQLDKNGTPVTFDLAEGAKGEGFSFDRFGLLTMRKGGGKPHAIFFDKLIYTVAP